MKCLIALLVVTLMITFVSSSFHPDCTDAIDGLYALGSCEPRFLTCSSGIARIMDCPVDLVYHKSQEICDWKHNVFECGESVEGSGEGSIDISGDGSGSQDETGSGSGEISSGDEIFQNVCENLKDGVYSSGVCTNQFFICSSNSPRFLSCSTPLYYDSIKQECSWRESIEECKKDTEMSITEENDSGYRGSEEESSGEGSGELTQSCEAKVDGIYPIDECSDNFLTCSGGVGRMINCPSTLYFNPSLLVCDWPKNVIGCTGKLLPKPTCEKDGYYSFGHCSSSFTACTNDVAIIMFCPSGLRFSQSTQMCDYEHNVQECPEKTEDEFEETSGYELPDRYDKESPRDLLTPCTNMENGLYALDCSPRVLSCQYGHENIFECPASLVFNEQSLICDYPETSLKCKIEDTLLIRDSAVATYDCMVDGLFSNALCSRTYHKCSGGQLIKHECADSNTVFSTLDAKCVDSSILPQCQ